MLIKMDDSTENAAAKIYSRTREFAEEDYEKLKAEF